MADQQGRLQPGQGAGEFEDGLAAVVRGAVEERAVGRDQHGRFEPAEAVGGGLGRVVLAAADQTAPRLAAARNAMIACGVLGRYPTTRSPGPTPSSRRVAATEATEATRARNCRPVTSYPAPVSYLLMKSSSSMK